MLDRFYYASRLNHVFSLAEELKWQGVPATVVVTDCPPQARSALQNCYQRRVSFYTNVTLEGILDIARRAQVTLVHVHSLHLLSLAQKVAQILQIPYGVTVHEKASYSQYLPLFQQAAFIITPAPSLWSLLNVNNLQAVYLPEGINLEEFQPPPAKRELKAAYIAEKDGYTKAGYQALLKAAAMADLYLEVVCPEKITPLRGQYRGWLPLNAEILRESQVVIGQGRTIIEGMACGNAALLLGYSYRGLIQPSQYSALDTLDLVGSEYPDTCYRNIFYDLAQLLKDGEFLASLQAWGRRYALENHDLHLIAERTVQVYKKSPR